MHKQIVVGVVFLPYLLRTRAAMGTAENARASDKRIDLAAADDVENLRGNKSSDRTEAESTQSEYDDFKRVERKERSTDCLRSDDRTEQNRNDIAKLVACGFGESFGNEALFEPGCRA